MWIFTNNSYLSVVENRDDKSTLLVRARIKGDIENVFPNAKVFSKKGADYKYRTIVSKEDVAIAVAKQIMEIDYDNFKNSIDHDDHDRHDVYLEIWSVMLDWQKGNTPSFANWYDKY